MNRNRLLHLSLGLILQWSLVLADYDCTCNYNVETGVFKTPDDTGTPIGYLYEFDCKPIYGPLNNGYSEIAFEHQIGYVKIGDQVNAQMCQGDLPDSDKVTTKAPTTTTTTTPAPKITTPVPLTTSIPQTTTTVTTTQSPTTTTTTPKPTTTTTTTPKPTTTTTTTPKPITTTSTTPKPTTTTTTTPKPTTTTTTTPKPTTTTTTTPKPTTTTTTTPKPNTSTSTKPPIPEGHVELCPITSRDDIQRNHGDLYQYGDYCYEFVPYKTQWKNGERHCNIVSSGHLVSIMSQDEQDFILRFLKSHNHTDHVWIGLTDADAEGTWRWSSGQPVGYKHFQATFSWHTENEHKLNDCIVLQSNGQWVDLPCGVALFVGTGFGEAHSYVCQYNLTSRPLDIFHGALAPFIVG